MNEIFNIRRFGLLFRKTILERQIQIIGTFALSFSVVILIYYFFKLTGDFEIAQLFSFTIGLVGGGCLLASLVFGYFSDNGSSASYLTLPASGFEKWLCGIIIVGIIYFIGFLLYYRGIDTIFVHLYHNSLNPQDPRYTFQYDQVYLFSFTDDTANIILMFFLNAAGAMLIGSLYFNKLSFLKVALIICGIYFFSFFVNFIAVKALFKDAVSAYPFHMVRIKNAGESGVVVLPSKIDRLRDIIMFYGFPTVLWGLSFVRLTEKEV